MKENQKGSIELILIVAIVAAIIAGSAYLLLSADSSGPDDDTIGTDSAGRALVDRYAVNEINPAMGVVTESDIARLKVELGNWSANNNGRLPSPSQFETDFSKDGGGYIGKYESIDTKKLQLLQLIDDNGQEVSVPDLSSGDVYVVSGAKCNDTRAVAGSSRSAAILYSSGDAWFCTDY